MRGGRVVRGAIKEMTTSDVFEKSGVGGGGVTRWMIEEGEKRGEAATCVRALALAPMDEARLLGIAVKRG